MVSYYGYEIWRHKEQLVRPLLSEAIFSTIKVKLVDDMIQVPVYVIFYMSSTKHYSEGFGLEKVINYGKVIVGLGKN